MAVRIQLLGPVRAWRDAVELDLGGPQQRAVLALLAAASAAGQRVSGSELADGLWGEQPPASADNVIQTYLKRLRRLLEPDRPARNPSRLLRRVAGGYLLDQSSIDVDVARFHGLVAAAMDAQRAGDQRRAAERLGAALRLFAGPPMADLPSLRSHPRVVALAGERWRAAARYGEAMLAIGKVAGAMPALAEAATACPFDEAMHALLVRAYHALGRREQAFAAYHTVRRRLADELGVDPGPELAAAHAALLADDRDPSPDQTTAPAQLPMATASFAGRV